MAGNLPGPYEIEFTLAGWTSPSREHVIRVSVAAVGTPSAGDLPTVIDIQKAGGGTAKLNVVADQLWSFFRLMYPSGITCNGYQFWKYVPGTLAKDFISTGSVANPTGATGAGTGVIAHQSTLTFRSANGGIAKLVFLEGANTGDQRITLIPNASGVTYQRVAAYVMSADNVILARDDSYPVAALRAAFGQNERVWRTVYRS